MNVLRDRVMFSAVCETNKTNTHLLRRRLQTTATATSTITKAITTVKLNHLATARRALRHLHVRLQVLQKYWFV